MNKIFSKKNLSNVIFILAIILLIYTPTRTWILRQIAFAPSVEKVENSEKIDTYNWQLKGVNSEAEKFIDFNGLKGEVVIVNFWATWCPSCGAEKPMFQKLYNDYKDKVTFLFVTNENKEVVNAYFSKTGYNLPAYNSKSMPPKLFLETNSIPASYLIDSEGNVRIKKVGAADWNSTKIRKFIDELIQQ
ncbi:TlpA disulfide reductase family protein [Lutibacter sp. TH_r2]|uniref:TlpA family protein disulfide reductase n=1 Tax=Lutibacter sp. TH_r2 TaxID=3082083 RepID=UPI00295464A7|nr:TlpA disulfide reductase family protein [Lutibacter sp. TH_r2]MDV7187562.1 TlpA disulfide reductase family protein [Lutibacter sp. TH_r2]